MFGFKKKKTIADFFPDSGTQNLIKCERCGKEFSFTQHNTVLESPNDKRTEMIKNKTLFNAVCPDCGFEKHYDFSVNYVSPEKGIVLIYCPDWMSYKKAYTECVWKNSEFSEWRRLRKTGFVTRIVRSQEEFFEKFECFSEGLDDRELEIVKAKCVLEYLKTNPGDQFVDAAFYLQDGSPFIEIYTDKGPVGSYAFPGHILMEVSQNLGPLLPDMGSSGPEINKKWAWSFIKEYDKEAGLSLKTFETNRNMSVAQNWVNMRNAGKESIIVVCQKCRKEFSYTLHYDLSVVTHPKYIMRIKDGSLFEAVCTKCGERVGINNYFIYNQVKNGMMVFGCAENKNVTDCTVDIIENKFGGNYNGIFSKKNKNKKEEDGESSSAGAITRIVQGPVGLREKIAISDKGLDDRVVELVKFDASDMFAKESGRRNDFCMFFTGKEDGCFSVVSSEGKDKFMKWTEFQELYREKESEFARYFEDSDCGSPVVDREWALRFLINRKNSE